MLKSNIISRKKCKSTADKALTVHFFSYFSYGMSYCFLIAITFVVCSIVVLTSGVSVDGECAANTRSVIIYGKM